MFILALLAVLLMLTGVQPFQGLGLVLLVLLAAADQSQTRRR
jgi:hypothetical protein